MSKGVTSILLEKQTGLIQILREGFVLTKAQVQRYFKVKDADSFIAGVINRTGINIITGKQQIPPMADTSVYFLSSNESPEFPGLTDMSFVEDNILTELQEEVEWQEGHYLMWICPTVIGCSPGEETEYAADFCGQFHKVDLGDTPLTEIKTVRCTKCGTPYQVKPKSWK